MNSKLKRLGKLIIFLSTTILLPYYTGKYIILLTGEDIPSDFNMIYFWIEGMIILLLCFVGVMLLHLFYSYVNGDFTKPKKNKIKK